jgi:hypothetical protein
MMKDSAPDEAQSGNLPDARGFVHLRALAQRISGRGVIP